MRNGNGADCDGGASILVVDDERDLLDILTIVLGDAGYMVACVGSGEEAVDRAKAERFDLVLTDYKMPGMDGIETLDALAKLDPTMRAVLMTGYTSDDVRAALKASGRRHILKPFTFQDLLATLGAELGH